MTENNFTGWIRLPGQLWQPVVTAADEDAAWNLLRQYVDQLGAKMIDMFIGPASIDPRSRRRTPMQRRMF